MLCLMAVVCAVGCWCRLVTCMGYFGVYVGVDCIWLRLLCVCLVVVIGG